jgi:hypothetical protein
MVLSLSFSRTFPQSLALPLPPVLLATATTTNPAINVAAVTDADAGTLVAAAGGTATVIVINTVAVADAVTVY